MNREGAPNCGSVPLLSSGYFQLGNHRWFCHDSGVIGMAVSVLLTDGHTVTLSKFDADPEEVSIITSWQR